MRLLKRLRREPHYWPIEYEQLATYNAEYGRGVLHDPKWASYMAEVQERYDVEHGIVYKEREAPSPGSLS